TFDIHVTDRQGETKLVVLHDMELEARGEVTVDLDRHGPALEEAFIAAFAGKLDNDSFNKLILSAGLSAHEVRVIRTYARDLRQTGVPDSQNYTASTLDRYPRIAAAIFRLFHDTLTTKLGDKIRLKKLDELHQTIEKAPADVPSLDDDRILR